MTGFKHIWIDECMPRLQMFVPKLVFADSALWMWIPQLKMRRIQEVKDEVFQCWKDEYFATNPAIDYNN